MTVLYAITLIAAVILGFCLHKWQRDRQARALVNRTFEAQRQRQWESVAKWMVTLEDTQRRRDTRDD